MSVSERVPRNTWLSDPITCRRKHAVVEVLLVKRRPSRRAKHQLVRRPAFRAGPMRLQQSSKESTDRNNAVAASSFWRTELTVRISLGNFDCAAKHVNTLPAKSEDFADPQPCQHRKLNNRETRFRQLWQELAYLSRGIESVLDPRSG